MLIRRVRKSEKEILCLLCQSDKRWPVYFTRHQKWVEKAISDVESENRVVFGAFSAKQLEGGKYDSQLIACIFLKLSLFENSIEFKNIVLPSDSIELDNESSVLAKQLISKSVRFCEVRGIDKVEIEIPQKEHGIISIFLELGFKIVALRERFDKGNLVCTLERLVGDFYFGDPFDTIKFSKWLLKSYIPCNIISTKIIEVGNNEWTEISFVGRTTTKAFSEENSIGKIKKLRGQMWVIEDTENIEEDIKNLINLHKQRPPLTLLLSNKFTDDSKVLLAKAGITYFESSEQLTLAGGVNSSLAIPIKQDNITGVVTVLEQDQIIKFSKKESLTYYLLSGLHNGLDFPSDEERILIIYCPDWYKQGGGIVGFCIIKEMQRTSFKRILERKLPDDSSLSKEDISFYQTYSEEEPVAQLGCTRISLIEQQKGIENANWVTNERVREYLKKEIIENGSNSAYLDKESVDNLRAHFIKYGYYQPNEKNTDKSPKKRFKASLSYSSDNRDYVKKIAEILSLKYGKEKIFYDEHFESELNGPGLDLHLSDIYRNQCELIVVLFSKNYSNKMWCGIEWNVIKEIVYQPESKTKVMFFKFGEVEIRDLSPLNGISDIKEREPQEITKLISEKLDKISHLP
ncbi:MAG: TIR domain-containing protein [Bacteroidota bacterium]